MINYIAPNPYPQPSGFSAFFGSLSAAPGRSIARNVVLPALTRQPVNISAEKISQLSAKSHPHVACNGLGS